MLSSLDVKLYCGDDVRIFLHIGDGRTGTTTLQALLSKNREKLQKQGLDYPKVGLLHPRKGTAQHKLAFSLMEEWPAFADKHRTDAVSEWTAFREYLDDAAHTYAACFISSEGFCSLPVSSIKFISDFLRTEDVSVIYVRRDYADRQRSMREHKIRRGHYVPDVALDNPDRSKVLLENWQIYFPVNVIDYDASSIDKVMEICGVDISEFEAVSSLNVRPPEGLLELLNSLNKIEMTEGNRGQINETIWSWATREKDKDSGA